MSRCVQRPRGAALRSGCAPIPRNTERAKPRIATGFRLDTEEQGRQDLNLQPPVLETGALPIELRPSVAPRIVSALPGHYLRRERPANDNPETSRQAEDDLLRGGRGQRATARTTASATTPSTDRGRAVASARVPMAALFSLITARVRADRGLVRGAPGSGPIGRRCGGSGGLDGDPRMGRTEENAPLARILPRGRGGHASSSGWNSARTKDKALRDRLILTYAPLVKYVAGRLGSGLPAHVDEGDLVSYGLLGLIGAIERYDPTRDIKFETYAIARIKGAIIDELRALDWVPRSVRSRAREIERAIAELEAKTGHRADRRADRRQDRDLGRRARGVADRHLALVDRRARRALVGLGRGRPDLADGHDRGRDRPAA